MTTSFKIQNRTIETPRLLLRAWRQSDLADFYGYASVDGVGECAGWPHHEDVQTSQKILNSFMEGDEVFAITDKASGKAIGSLGVHDSRQLEVAQFAHLPACEIGFVLSKAYWGQGMMTEAVRAAIVWLFANTELEILYCAHFSFNDRSRRVIERCGFTYLCDATYNSALGKIFDDLVYYVKK